MARSFVTTGKIVGSSATPINFNFNSTFSAGGWFWLSSIGAGNTWELYGHLDPASSFRGWEILWNATIGTGGSFDCFLVNVFPTTAIEQPFDAAASSVAANTWVHFLLTYNGNTLASGMKGYINGALATLGVNQHDSLGSNTTTNTIPPLVGSRNDNSTLFNGRAADTAAWNVVLSASEAAALGKGYCRPFQIRPQNLVHYWPLDGIQSPEPDLSGNANNGTLTNASLAFGPPFTPFTPRWPQFTALPPLTLWAQSCM